MVSLLYVAMTVVAVAMMLRGARWGIAGLAFLIPLSARLPSLPIPTLNTQNFLVLAGFAWLLATSAKQGRVGKVRYAIPILAFCFLVTAAYLTTMFFWVPNEWARRYNPYQVTLAYKCLLTCLMLYVLGCLVARRAEDVRVAVTGLLAGTAFEGLFVCLEVVLHGPARANGHLAEPNSAGAYLAWAVALGFSFVIVLGLSGWAGRLALATAGLCGVGLIFTLSRGNWLAAIAGASFIAVLKDRRVLILIVIALVTHNLWLPDKAQNRLNETLDEKDQETAQVRNAGDIAEVEKMEALQSFLTGGQEGDPNQAGIKLDSSSQIRLYVWMAALKMIEDHPLGVGYGLFRYYLPAYSPVYRFRAAHNTYLLLAAETGVLGLLTFLLLLGLMMLECWRAWRTCHDPWLRAVAIAAIASTFSMAISSFFYSFFFTVEINGQQWLLLGVAMQLRRVDALQGASETTDEPAPEPGPRPLYELVT